MRHFADRSMRFAILTLLLIVLPPKAGLAQITSTAEKEYAALLAAWEGKAYRKALVLAEDFVKKHPKHAQIAMASYIGGNSGTHAMNLARAVPFCRAILEKHPDFEKARDVRDELTYCLSGLRKLDACIAQCRENLEADPSSPYVDHWRFLIPQSQFRLWQFEEARRGLLAFLEQHPDSSFSGAARDCLEKIEPKWEIDESGRVPYSGKYEKDVRFQKAWNDLPRFIDEGYTILKDRLGVDLRRKVDLVFLFQDAGFDSRQGQAAQQFVIARNGKPFTAIRFFTEHVVLDPESYRRNIVHEMKHAGFTTLMGQGYPELPNWVREGLALWSSGELEDRMQAILLNEVFSLRDPRKVLDGIEDPDHDLQDYLEDALAFEWLESRKRGNVKRYCRLILDGKPYQKSFAQVSGLEYERALGSAEQYCQKRVDEALGSGLESFVTLRDEFYAKFKEGQPALARWSEEGAAERFRAWLGANEGHPLEPFARLCLGRALAIAGHHEEGRRYLQAILDKDRHRSTLSDDAQFWIGYSYHLEGNKAAAAEAFGVLLRDYSWSPSATRVKGQVQPAGPVTGN